MAWTRWGRGARSHTAAARELASRQAVRRAAAAQHAEHVETTLVELVHGQHDGATFLEQCGQPGDRCDDADRRHVDIRTFAAPRAHELGDLIPR
jgi:hypothetical protein